MQIILDIERSQKDIILNIINNLKEGIIKKYTLINSSNIITKADIEAVSVEEEQEIKELLSNMSADDKQIVDTQRYSINL